MSRNPMSEPENVRERAGDQDRCYPISESLQVPVDASRRTFEHFMSPCTTSLECRWGGMPPCRICCRKPDATSSSKGLFMRSVRTGRRRQAKEHRGADPWCFSNASRNVPPSMYSIIAPPFGLGHSATTLTCRNSEILAAAATSADDICVRLGDRGHLYAYTSPETIS
eukprot:326645-Rhodomonas_salina.1